MNSDTMLHRQIHPGFIQASRVSSQAFRPTPKDQQLLSVYDGDQMNAENSWRHYTEQLRLASVGVLGLKVSEFEAQALPARPDPLDDFPAHAVVDYSALTNSMIEKKSRILRKLAEDRGWLYQPDTN